MQIHIKKHSNVWKLGGGKGLEMSMKEVKPRTFIGS